MRILAWIPMLLIGAQAFALTWQCQDDILAVANRQFKEAIANGTLPANSFLKRTVEPAPEFGPYVFKTYFGFISVPCSYRSFVYVEISPEFHYNNCVPMNSWTESELKPFACSAL